MNREEKIEEIDRKCRVAGCDEKSARRHLQLFVYERWDVHPPSDFCDWARSTGESSEDPKTGRINYIAAWNSARARQGFNEWIELGHPEPIAPRIINHAAGLAKLKETISRIGG